MLRRLQSLSMLAWALFKTLLRRLFPQPDSLLLFEKQYGAEGLLQVERAEAELLAQPGRCTACGRCDRSQGPRVAESRVGYRGMMAFVLAARSMPDSRALARAISELHESDFDAAEKLCPEQVPLVQLARFVRHHAERMQRSA